MRKRANTRHFNPRTPCGVRPRCCARTAGRRYFNPRTPCGVRRTLLVHASANIHFNPRTPCGVRPPRAGSRCSPRGISIHAPLAGCDFFSFRSRRISSAISIHAPLAGCDLASQARIVARTISIHAPLAGCDRSCQCSLRRVRRFQSTHPLRGATPYTARQVALQLLISIHTPLAGCDLIKAGYRVQMRISIHAPLAGCDAVVTGGYTQTGRFQSTHPLRGATRQGNRSAKRKDFNPRTPCGVRPGGDGDISAKGHAISIHAPLAGCDNLIYLLPSSFTHFNPRTPCGVRLALLVAAP